MKFRKTYKRKQAAVLLSVFLLVTSVAGCQRVGAVKGEAEKNEGYYLAELHGYVVVYLSDQSTIYEFTDLCGVPYPMHYIWISCSYTSETRHDALPPETHILPQPL